MPKAIANCKRLLLAEGGEKNMKKFVTWLLVSLFALSVAACAPAEKQSYLRLKCPACGYEFDGPKE